MRIKIGSKTFDRSLLIPSISSFETRVSGSDALSLQQVLREPISLISAFDLRSDEVLADRANKYREAGGILFLDSGGYESSRIARYLRLSASDPSEIKSVWSFTDYRSIAEGDCYDLAASFDTFIEPDENYTEFHDRYISFLQDHDFIDPLKFVPVLHLQDQSGERTLTDAEWLEMVETIAANIAPPFIAIPERELGSGIVEKYSFAKRLVAHAAKHNDCKIHILGCGNLLTFALFAHAGVALADGLEWCRTFTGKDFHLFHFQHYDTIDVEEQISDNPFISAFRESGIDREALALVYNLQSQQDFSLLLAESLRDGKLSEFLTSRYELTPNVRSMISA